MFSRVHKPFVIIPNSEPYRLTRTRHYKHLNCNPISSLFFSPLDLEYGGVHSNYPPLKHECKRPKTTFRRKKKKENLSLAAGHSFKLHLREELDSRGRKETHQTCLLSCGEGRRVAVCVAPGHLHSHKSWALKFSKHLIFSFICI